MLYAAFPNIQAISFRFNERNLKLVTNRTYFCGGKYKRRVKFCGKFAFSKVRRRKELVHQFVGIN